MNNVIVTKLRGQINLIFQIMQTFHLKQIALREVFKSQIIPLIAGIYYQIIDRRQRICSAYDRRMIALTQISTLITKAEINEPGR